MFPAQHPSSTCTTISRPSPLPGKTQTSKLLFQRVSNYFLNLRVSIISSTHVFHACFCLPNRAPFSSSIFFSDLTCFSCCASNHPFYRYSFSLSSLLLAHRTRGHPSLFAHVSKYIFRSLNGRKSIF